MAYRVDRRGSVTKVDRLPQGGIRVDAALTRVGVLRYYDAAGNPIDEYRPPAEVSHADSLASLADAPVTDGHPKGRVTPANFQIHNRGHLSGSPRMDGELVAGLLVIQDETLLGKIERGDAREVSCGYTCDLLDTPGVTPDGIKFDKIQTNIVYNHVAIVERGRAGSQVSLRLDSSGDTLTEDENSVTPEQIKALEAELAKAKADAAAAQGRADAAQAQAAAAQARADAAASPAVVQAAVSARLALQTQAVSVLGADFKADALSDADLRKAVIAKVFPDLTLDGKAEGYAEALFDAAIKAPKPEAKADDADEIAAVRGAVQPKPAAAKADDDTADEKLRADAQAKRDKMHLEPLAYSAKAN